MKKDILAGHKLWFWILLFTIIFTIVGVLTPTNIGNILWTILFFIIGGLCLWNYNRCGRVHCQITGWGFLAVGVIALLNILGIIDISWSTIWMVFFAVLIIGYGKEFFYSGKTGSCYKK